MEKTIRYTWRVPVAIIDGLARETNIFRESNTPGYAVHNTILPQGDLEPPLPRPGGNRHVCARNEHARYGMGAPLFFLLRVVTGGALYTIRRESTREENTEFYYLAIKMKRHLP